MAVRSIFLLVAFLVATPLLGITQAATDTTLKQMKLNVKTSCQTELDSYCKDITPGEGRLASCLNSRENQLSQGCRDVWDSTKADISNRMDKAQVEFRKDCSSDVKKYCSGVPSGKGRVLSCLDRNHNLVSNQCQQFQAKLGQRLSEFLG